ncbi:MAG: cupin domain-containing protein [Psychrosphaera sp.]|nr:cupin domain-containing protein [Psychrosphaera sp.]
MPKATAISINEQLAKLTFLSNRTPQTTSDEAKGAFASLSDYRDGAIFISHYAGNSEWETHPKGDEKVMVMEGETSLILWQNDVETANLLHKGELFVVPQGVWHRFETPKGVKVLAITPQPTTHSLTHPRAPNG